MRKLKLAALVLVLGIGAFLALDFITPNKGILGLGN